mmetsp:Transcript_11847/g.16059  ORF Transcript_11847/g.16059 Transcript_11847/m.16059 type:complete len:186 (-) Transcript_11847:48-605(-)
MAHSAPPAFVREVWERGLIMLKFGCFVNVFHNYVGQITVCEGPSMLPTLSPSGDIVLAECLTIHKGDISKGDVVVATCPTDPKKLVCKRVLGRGGEKVRVMSDGFMEPNKIVKVPPGHVWLQGDNAANSNDSRHYGPVPEALVKSRVFLRVIVCSMSICWAKIKLELYHRRVLDAKQDAAQTVSA